MLSKPKKNKLPQVTRSIKNKVIETILTAVDKIESKYKVEIRFNIDKINFK